MMYSLAKQWNSKWLKSTRNSKTLLYLTRLLSKLNWNNRRKKLSVKLEKGQVLEGTVKNITSYGVFIDLGGVDGLIHITDLSWGRVSDPKEVVELDQKLNVVILDFDDEKETYRSWLETTDSAPMGCA